ncbi:MAG TPA: SUF system NifU family Fe-S cluster assembly protein [Gemmatimonadaceae bacterium]|nr:SUF system NifU family Fe-S cluster assembly protein [Gemmatimonadaceae bacterium]
MTEIDALYEEVILDHNRSPRNWGELPGATNRIEGRNPLCGDELTLWLRMDSDRIADIRFVGQGCAISRASASLMTQAVKGKTRAEAEEMANRFQALLTAGLSPEEAQRLGSLKALAGVRRFPMRVKCATLPWHALRGALHSQEVVEER